LIGFLPTIYPEVWQRYPEYRALSVVVRDFRPEPGAPIPAIPLELPPG